LRSGRRRYRYRRIRDEPVGVIRFPAAEVFEQVIRQGQWTLRGHAVTARGQRREQQRMSCPEAILSWRHARSPSAIGSFEIDPGVELQVGFDGQLQVVTGSQYDEWIQRLLWRALRGNDGRGRLGRHGSAQHQHCD
jgi:hypothetical protein